VLSGKSGLILIGQGIGTVMENTDQQMAHDSKQTGNSEIFPASRHDVEGCGPILRIMLLLRRADPYSTQHDIRGVLLDSYC
jgi:hypothetical protein